ncbi:WD repeat protein iqw1 [Aspergillus udagawae]|uniref:WD repeat protein iqw1 n=1 Tax=Aspergillus udagawae TaxID=91492 RepID=A0ABQ1AIE1_9EURO|nr:WD repeat protein iqw1 [Aspergillus udagawae]
MPIPTRSLSLRGQSKQSTTGRTATTKTTDGDGDGSADTSASTSTADRRKSLLPQRSIPVRDRDRDGAAPVRQQQVETRLQRGSRILSKMPVTQQHKEEGFSESSTAVAASAPATATTMAANTRRRSLIRPSPLKTGIATGAGARTGTGTGTATGMGTNPNGRVATTPKSATFDSQGCSTSPRKRDGVSSMSPKKTDMPPPARPTRSASMRQPLKAGAGAGSGAPATGIRHVRHRSQIVAPSSSQTQVAKRSDSQSSVSMSTTTGLASGRRSSGQFTTYQQQFSPRKVVRPAALSAARASADGEDSLIPATWPEIAALQTELLQLSLLHSSSLQQMAALESESEEQLQTKYDAVAKTYRAIVGEEKKCQRLLNGQALNRWLEHASEHGGRQNFAAQIQVFSQLVQEVCDLTDSLGGRYTLLVQEFEEWFRKAQAIESMRLHRQQADASHVVFIDPLDRVWKDEVHAMTMKLEQNLRQLQSLDIAGYDGPEQVLADAALVRTAKGLDVMIASMVDELKAIRRIEAQIVRSERQWVSQLTANLAATHPRDVRGPRPGMWRAALLRS